MRTDLIEFTATPEADALGCSEVAAGLESLEAASQRGEVRWTFTPLPPNEIEDPRRIIRGAFYGVCGSLVMFAFFMALGLLFWNAGQIHDAIDAFVTWAVRR